jgi:hypothetical protein
VIDLNADPAPERPPVPILPVSVDVGLGKTRAWLEQVAASLRAAGRTGVLAVPRHKLGDEIVRDLAALGVSGHVYRGREAADPDAPGEKMCRELERVNRIEEALGDVARCACKYKDKKCDSFDICGYQKQRDQNPDIWITPHQLLFKERPSFFPRPDALAIDEAFWQASLHGVDEPYRLWLNTLRMSRYVPAGQKGRVSDPAATADLIAISTRVFHVLGKEPSGRLRGAALVAAGITGADVADAYRLEWRRKIEPDVLPGMPLARVKKICGAIAAHNQMVARLARFWELLGCTLAALDERSPWLELRLYEPLPRAEGTAPAVLMVWRDGIHLSWMRPTILMDATMPTEIVRQFFPNMPEPLRVSAPMPHTYVRQIVDRAMTAEMLIPAETANERTNATRFSNVERVRRVLQVRAADVYPGIVLVVCQAGLETALVEAGLPDNVKTAHFNDISGQNAWQDVALVVVIGTEPPPRTVERLARAVFGADVQEIEADAQGAVRYPRTMRGIRMRDGRGIAVEGPFHPDPRAEWVRWAMCEVGLVQAVGRGRGVNRTADNPLQIDILTNVVLPLEVDEVTTWDRIQPGAARVMRAAGAVPIGYADMARAYAHLFPSADAARMTLTREAKNPEQTPIEEEDAAFSENPEQTPIEGDDPSPENPEQTPIGYLLAVCSGFSRLRYRHRGSRGPAGALLYDPGRVEPRSWLAEHLGEVVWLDAEDAVEPPRQDQHAGSWPAGFVEHRIEFATGRPHQPVRAEVTRCELGSPGTREGPKLKPVEVDAVLAIRATPVGSGSLSSLGVSAGLLDEPTRAGGPGGGPAQGDDELAAICDDFDEERAAIIEFDGDVPRPWAEAFARLDPERPRDGIPGPRWHQFIDDAGGFLDSPFRAVAVDLGWQPQELFGAGDRPSGQVDYGLLWLLNGGKLVMLEARTATIETPAGLRRTWRRKLGGPGRPARWEQLP